MKKTTKVSKIQETKSESSSKRDVNSNKIYIRKQENLNNLNLKEVEKEEETQNQYMEKQDQGRSK